MKHVLALRNKGILVKGGTEKNYTQAYEVARVLMQIGIVMDPLMVQMLAGNSKEYLTEMYLEISTFIKRTLAGGGVHLYEEFPNIPMIPDWEHHLASWQSLVTGQSVGTKQIEAVDGREYFVAKLFNEAHLNQFARELIYKNESLSELEKEIISYFIQDGLEFEISEIKFKDTKAWIEVGSWNQNLVTQTKANQILRTWAAWSGYTWEDFAKAPRGKRKGRFNKPSPQLRHAIRVALDKSPDLEESFKANRELWLRALYWLNIGGHPELERLHKYSFLLRGGVQNGVNVGRTEKKLKTYNARLEELYQAKDEKIFDMLAKNKGYFVRQLSRLLSVFGTVTFDYWLKTNPTILQAVIAYNWLESSKFETGSYVGAGNNQVSSYNRKTVDEDLIDRVKTRIKEYIQSNKLIPTSLNIPESLYGVPVQSANNRAASSTLFNTAKMKKIGIPMEAFRISCTWDGRHVDYDFSAVTLKKDGTLVKYGWNGLKEGKVIYSGDNQGSQAKNNQESLSFNFADVEDQDLILFVVNAFSNHKFRDQNFRAGLSFARTRGDVQGSAIENSARITSESRDVVLGAVHVPTRTWIVLDLALGKNTADLNVSDTQEINEFVLRNLSTGTEKLPARLYCGHVLEWTSFGQDDTMPETQLDQKAILNLIQ